MDQTPKPSDDPTDPPKPTRLSTRSEVEISEAIQECAKKCMEHREPLACAETFIMALIAAGCVLLA